MGIKRPGPDHIGFKVENIDDVQAARADHDRACNTFLMPMPLGGNKEAEARKSFLAKTAGGKYQMADPGGNWIVVTDE